MIKKQSKDQQHIHQYSSVLIMENSLNSDQFSASPPKDNTMAHQNQEPQFQYTRQQQEEPAQEIHEIKQEEKEAGQNLQDFMKPVDYEPGEYQEEKHDSQRHKILRELLHERQLNRNQQLKIEEKDQIISALQEERRLFENEHKLRNDGLQEKKRALAAEKQKLEEQNAKIQRERQEKRQELQWQQSNRNTLNIIITQYGQAISSALERYSKAFERDEADRVLSQLKQQSPSIDQNTLQVDKVNLYLTQSLKSFTNIVIKKHQEKQRYYSYRLRETQNEHKRALAKQEETHLAKLNQLRSQLLQKQKDLDQKVAKIESLTYKIGESQANYLTNVESSRQQTKQHLDKIAYLTTALQTEKTNSQRKLGQLSSESEEKYLKLVKRAQEDIKLLQVRFSASQASLEQDIKELKMQKRETENNFNELTSSLTSKDELIKVLEKNLQSFKQESQKLEAFKSQNKKIQAEYLKTQTKLKQDFAKQINQMKRQHKDIKDQNESKLSDLKYKLQNQHTAQQLALKGQIEELKKQIVYWKNKEQNYLDDIQNLKASFQAKEKVRQAYKTEFQIKTAEVIESIVKDESVQSQGNKQIFLETAEDLHGKLAQQSKDKQLLCRNYCKLDEKYNELSKEHFLQSIKLQETTQSLLQVQFKEQICMKEITQLRVVLSNIQEMHKNVVEEMQNNFDKKLSMTIEETSQFYQVILNSKDKIYETDLQKLQQELQSLRLVKNIKEKISADNEIRLENQRQDLMMKIKAMQREHDSAFKANKNEITALTESTQFLKKSLDLSAETLEAKQRILQSLQNQKALFRKTINFIHNQLDEKSLQQVLDELDRSNDTFNQEVIDMVNGIFFSVSDVSIQNKRLEQENLQITQEKEKLGYILKEIKLNAEDKDKKLERIEKTATQTSKFQEKINSLEAELKSAKNKSEEYLKSLNRAQESAKKSEEQLESIRNSEKQVRTDNERIKAKLEQATKAKNDFQRMLSEKETQLKGQIRDLNQKIDTLTRERNLSNKEMESSMKKEIEQLKIKLQAQNTRITKLQLQIRELKNGNERLMVEKSALERKISDLQQDKRQLEETIKRLKTREQEPVRRLVNSPNSRDSQKLIQYEQKASQLEIQNKKLEKDISETKNELAQSKKNVKSLLDEINQLKRDLDDAPKLQDRKSSWNEQEDLVRGYQQIANNLREENTLLQQQVESLKEKLKKFEANNQRSIKN